MRETNSDNYQIKVVQNGSVAEVVLAVESEPQIGRRDDGIVVLKKYFCTKRLSFPGKSSGYNF